MTKAIWFGHNLKTAGKRRAEALLAFFAAFTDG
jgi:hypothetical protein